MKNFAMLGFGWNGVFGTQFEPEDEFLMRFRTTDRGICRPTSSLAILASKI